MTRQMGLKAMSGSTRECGARRESKTWKRENSGRERARRRLTPDVLTTDSCMEQSLGVGDSLSGVRGKLRTAWWGEPARRQSGVDEASWLCGREIP